MTLAKLQTPVKQALDATHSNAKRINARLNKYNKAMKEVSATADHPSSQRTLLTPKYHRNSKTRLSPPPKMTPSHPTPPS